MYFRILNESGEDKRAVLCLPNGLRFSTQFSSHIFCGWLFLLMDILQLIKWAEGSSPSDVL